MASPLSLDVGYFFVEFQCLPVDDCPAVSCDSGVLARGSESTSFYSTILVPNGPVLFFFNIYLFRLRQVLVVAYRIFVAACGIFSYGLQTS